MHDRSEASRAAALSILAALILTSMKLVTGILSNSIGLISEALHSGLDLVAAAITFTAVTRASKAADDEHQYGHGKIENFSALAETFILWITAIWIIYEALRRIIEMEFAEPTLIGIGVMIISIIVDYERSRMLYRTAEKYNSQALEADALHFSTDMLSSVVVLIGLVFLYMGFPLGDPLGALGVSVVIFVISFRLAKRSYDQLVDRAPSGIEEEVQSLCTGIPGVIECSRVRARHSGPFLFVDVVVSVNASTSVDDAHSIANLIEDRIATLAKSVDCVVHIEPIENKSEHATGDQIYAKMMDIARAHPKVSNLHNVRVLHVKNGFHILADLEMNPSLTINQAHDISKEVEEHLRNSLDNVEKITLHLESTESMEAATEITDDSNHVITVVKGIVKEVAPECVFHRAAVTKDASGLTITLDCGIKGDTTLTVGHELAELLKREIEQQVKCSSVLIHMEP
ncbi:MAG: cation-efflux pump, partial [Candidatus Thorarchaeota archaeon]